jgi:hypothetical protein
MRGAVLFHVSTMTGGYLMKKSLLALAALACSFSISAQTPSQSLDQFCVDRSNEGFAKELTNDSKNLMAFANHGGLANGGVCWWHSRFQRNALYLTSYNPSKAKPTSEEVVKIVDKIRDGKEVIEIPGYKNFRDFSYDHQVQIQRELEKWQKGDGVLKFNWVIGLKGDNVVSADKMKKMMDELYDYVENKGQIAYEKLQIKGVTAHAWLVVNMKKTAKGYDLEIIDSNYNTSTNIYRYTEGMTNFYHRYYGEFTPYLERKGEMDKLALSIMKKCEPEKYEAKKAEEGNRVANNETEN